MSILIPATTHQITWSVQDITDTTTYYVRAVIRDLRSGNTIDTLNLVDQGNNRFSKSWNVPQDPQGFGRIIEIEKTVYTDSGYTTASTIYGRYLEQYTIFNLANRNPSTGGGGGSSVDYKEISNSIKRQLDPALSILNELKSKEPEEPTDLSNVEGNLSLILEEVSKISQRVDLIEKNKDSEQANNNKLDSIKTEIISDLRPFIVSEIDNLRTNLEAKISSTKESTINGTSEDGSKIEDLRSEISGQFSDLFNKFEYKLQATAEDLKRDIDRATSHPVNIMLNGDGSNLKTEAKKGKRDGQINNLLNE